MAQELKPAGWKAKELAGRAQRDPLKMGRARRLSRETTLTIREIAGRLRMGSWKSLNNKLYLAARAKNTTSQGKAIK